MLTWRPMVQRTVMLEVTGLHAFYGSSHVLFGVDMSVGEGEVVAVLGRNGMGKTTLIRSIMGLLPAREGFVKMDGRELRGLTVDAIAKTGIGLVPEGRHIFPNLTSEENLIAMAANRNGTSKPWTLARVYEMFPRLAERRDSLGTHLSGGEQQMLAIGRALMTNPRLLMLDEATEGLAPRVRQTIWSCISTLRSLRQAILIVDRDLEKLGELADRQYVLEKGKVVWSGIASDFRANGKELEAYLKVSGAGVSAA
jgi:branched-chain amino acid transport system ATP-binding protein